MGGMWSLCALASVMILNSVFWSVVSLALRTLARSIVGGFSTELPQEEENAGLTRFGPRLRHRHLKRPHLPAHLVLAAHGVPVLLAPLLLEELHRHLAAAAAAARPRVLVRPVALRLELARERVGALVDERLDLGLGHVGQLEAEHVARLRRDGGEEAQEEDGVQDAWSGASGLVNVVPFGGANRPTAAGDMIGKLVTAFVGSGCLSGVLGEAVSYLARCPAPSSDQQKPPG